MVGHLNHFEPRFLLENEYFDQVLNGVIFSTKSMAELMCFCPKRRKIGYVGAQPVFRAVTLPLVLSTEPTRPERGSHSFPLHSSRWGWATQVNSILSYGSRELEVSVQTLNTMV